MIVLVARIAFLLLAGSLVGLISSFFGVGACFIMVPVMIHSFEKFFSVPTGLAPMLAFGTNMAVVVPTALSGVLRHRIELKKRKLHFPREHYVNFASFVGIGSASGSLFAYVLFSSFRESAGILLKTLFGIACLIGAYRFLTAKPLAIEELKRPEKAKYAIFGFIGGFIAHFIGIGGGIVYMPVLNAILKIPIHYAVGISLGSMVVGSSVGAVSFGILGRIDQLKHPELYPPMTFGWFNLIAFLGLGLTSVVSAQLGPRLAHMTSPKKFKVLLALVYLYIGLRLAIRGVFQLMGQAPPIP
ncbi:MAG: hypothetical protein DRO00_02690 [Thermoproteota archaeon]|nr:MAG: hypothetical protein DRO00_02690 [Candidatus Korarchaeota archaeon]